MKKFLLGIATLITITIICVVSAGAVIYGDYAYTSYGNGKIAITDYTGSATELDIPPLLDGQKVGYINYGAFANCTSLVSVSIPNGVTIMGENVFYGCISLKSVTIPGSVSSIGANAFSSCAEGFTINCYEGSYAYEYAVKNSINYKIVDKPTYEYEFFVDGTIEITGYNGTATEIEIPSVIDGNKVTAIGYRAFYESTPVTSVVIPNSVTTIDDQAFYYCESVESVDIPDSVTYIGQSAFQYCRALKTIEFPSSVTSIEGSVCYWCEGLTSVTIPSSVTSIGVNAFRDCRALETITIPGSVKTIEWGAFYDCNSLVSATINEGVEAIGESAFRDCEKLAYVSFPSTVTSIGEGVFIYSNNLKEIKVASGNKYYCSENGALFDKAKTKLIRYPSKSTATSYTIPSTVKTISDYAFETSYNLLAITIPDSVEAIGKYAFSSCLYTVTINIGKNVKTIGEDAFIGCMAIESIVIPEGVTRIEDNTFSQCEKLKNIVIPDSVTYIGEYAFSRCEALESVYIPDGVTYIAKYAFQYCQLLESAPIPDSVTYIGDYAFAYCGALQGVNLPDGLTYIGKRAFVKCYALTTINIPDTVTDIGYQAFAACNAAPTIIVGGSITEIDDMAFWYCKSLTKVIICDGVTTIGSEAFAMNNLLTDVVIPDSVTSIDATAFDDCENLVIYCCENSYALSYAKENSIAYKIVPSSVANLKVSARTSASVTLSWDKNSSATGYIVEQYKNGAWVKLADTTSCTYTVSGLSSCTDYAFSVTAYTTSGTENLTSAPAGLNVTTDHAYSSSYTIDTAATCTTDGSKSRHCTKSGCTATTSVTVIPSPGHSCTDTVVAPDYFNQGYTLHDCNNCDYSYKDTYTNKLTLSGVSDFALKSRNYNSITLNWTKNSKASGYIIQQMKDNAWVNVANIKDNTTTSYAVTGLTANTSYKFRAVAYVTNGKQTAYSGYTSAMTASTAPAMTTGLAITGRGSNYLTLSWTKNVGASGYVIQEQVNGAWKNVATVKGNATVSCKITGLQPNSLHRYRMVAYKTDANGTCYGKYTGSVSGYTAPAMVSGLKISATAPNSLTVSWTKVSSADGYVIDIYKNGKWSQLAKLTSNATTSYKASGLAEATGYKFRIKSYATNGTLTIYSTYSSPVIATTKVAAVENLRMTNRGTDFISVRWDKNENADGYMVYIYDGTKWTCVKTLTSASSVSHKITGLESGKTYKITVKAYKTVGGTKLISDTATISVNTL